MSEGRGTWLAIIGVLGVIVGVVALVIALDAKNGNQSDADIANSVHSELNRQIAAGKAALTTQGHKIRASGRAARRAQAQNAAQAKANKAQNAVTQSDINRLSGQISALRKQLKTIQADEQNQQAQLNKQGNQIQQLKITKKNRPGA